MGGRGLPRVTFASANGKRSLRRGGDEREAEDTSLQGTRGYEHNGNHKKTGSPLTRQIGAGLAGSGGTEWRQPGCAPEIESRLRKRGRRQVRVPATAAQGRPATARRAQCVTPMMSTGFTEARQGVVWG